MHINLKKRSGLLVMLLMVAYMSRAAMGQKGVGSAAAAAERKVVFGPIFTPKVWGAIIGLKKKIRPQDDDEVPPLPPEIEALIVLEVLNAADAYTYPERVNIAAEFLADPSYGEVFKEAVLAMVCSPEFTNDGWHPLVWAVDEGHADVVRMILARGVDLNMIDDSDPEHPATLLMKAVEQGNEPIVLLLLAHGANPLITIANGSIPLAIAEEKGFATIVALLKEKSKEGRVVRLVSVS